MCLASSERCEATLHDCVVINEGEHQLPAVLPNDIFSEQATLAKRAKRTPSRQGSGPRPKILAQKKNSGDPRSPGDNSSANERAASLNDATRARLAR